MKRIGFIILIFAVIILCANEAQYRPDSLTATVLADSTTSNDNAGNKVPSEVTKAASDSSESKDTTEKSFERLEKGFFISPAWQFGKSPLMTNWYENQLQKKEYYDTLFNALSKEDTTITHESVFTQKPKDQSITFPFSLGIYKQIDSTKSFSVGIDYAFQRKRSIFTYRNRLDSTVLYENKATISSHRISLLATFEYTFNSEYFSVKGFPRTGISLGIGGSPLNRVQLKNNGNILSENAYGGIWNAGIFTEKNISANIMRRVIIFYTGSITQPYHSFSEQLPTYSGEDFIRSGSFGIKVLFIFNRGTNKESAQE